MFVIHEIGDCHTKGIVPLYRYEFVSNLFLAFWL